MPCPECDGRGHLEQNCSSCNGRGQKSCPVCTKKMNEAGDGRVSCNLCSGDGSIAATGKSCSRCAGVGSSACLTCGGKAVRSCVPRVYGGRCPTCRSARRVPCRTCGGDKRVTEAVRARRLRVKNTAAIARAAAVSAKPGKKKSLGANARPASRVTGSVEATAEETPPPAAAGLESRFEAITAIHHKHFELFAVDPRPEFDGMRRGTLALKKEAERLSQVVTAEEKNVHLDVIAALKKHFDRIRSFARRWNSLRDLFDAELRTFRTLEETWETRQEVLSSTAQVYIDAETKRLNRRLDLALRLVQRKAKPLVDENPIWLADETAALETEWPTLKSKTEEYLTALKKAAHERELEANKAAAELAAERKSSALRKEAAARRADGRRSASRPAREAPPQPAPVTASKGTKLEPTGAAKTAPAQATTTTDATRTDTNSWTGSPAVWAFAGFAAAAGLFLVFGRRRDLPPGEPVAVTTRPNRSRSSRDGYDANVTDFADEEAPTEVLDSLDD